MEGNTALVYVQMRSVPSAIVTEADLEGTMTELPDCHPQPLSANRNSCRMGPKRPHHELPIACLKAAKSRTVKLSVVWSGSGPRPRNVIRNAFSASLACRI